MVSIRQWAWLVNLLLLAAVAYGVAALAMQLLGSQLEAGTAAGVVVRPPAQQEARREKMAYEAFQPVLDYNIFRARRSEVKSTTASAVQVSTTGPKVPLSVMLTGTVIMGKRAFAMVADASGRNEKLYRLQDCLPAGEEHPSQTCTAGQAKLLKVERKQALVDYQGEQITLELTERPVAATGAAPSSRSALRRPGTPVAAPAVGASDGAPFPMTQDGNRFDMRVPGVEVSQAFENFAEVLKQARVVPYSDESGQGFQIRNIRPGSIFARIGLNNFDKIKAVNGEQITTADQAMRLLTVFRNEKEISLDLERNNQPVQLNYVIE